MDLGVPEGGVKKEGKPALHREKSVVVEYTKHQELA